MRVGINGMGRTGCLALRSAMGAMYRPSEDPRADKRLDVVHVNEIMGGTATTAHLLEFDSVHGRWREDFQAEDRDSRSVTSHLSAYSEAKRPVIPIHSGH
jgi:glyceraldehyde 3-phosphate dehydrogenase